MPNRAKRSNYGPSPPDRQRRPCSPRRRPSPWRAGPRPPTMCPTSLLGLDVDPPWMDITWWQSLTLVFTSSSVLWSPSSSSLWWITLRDKIPLKKRSSSPSCEDFRSGLRADQGLVGILRVGHCPGFRQLVKPLVFSSASNKVPNLGLGFNWINSIEHCNRLTKIY